MYVELRCASAFSFLEAASLPEALVDRAAELGYPALALVDRDGVYGAPRFHKAATAAGIRPIIGCELTIGATTFDRSGGALAPPTPGRSEDRPLRGETWRLPVLVSSQEGYRNLCRLVTRMKLRAPKGEGALALEELDGFTSGLVALAGREALAADRHGVGGLADRLVGLFGCENVYIELERHLLRDEETDNQALLALASAFHLPAVATNGVRFARPDERPLYDVLTCIRHKTSLEYAGRRLARNAERYLKPPAEMAALFSDLPGTVAATRELAGRLAYTMADLGYRFPDYPVPGGETMMSFLRKIAEVGARERYRPYHERARAQIARELALIEKLDLAGYFLIVWDIVNYCRQHGILVQGRGSAANSAVCYSLGITAVDPVGMDLLFERFLSEERGEWPDIDLDLPSGDCREQVIQHVYEKYGQHGAAMTANVITYRGRSAAREVGKALGIEAAEVNRLARVMHNFEFVDPAEKLADNLRTVGFDPDHPRLRLFGNLWQRIQDLPRHLGQHSGGMVICQGRLDSVVPLENASMPGRVVVQWDKDDCAEMGIIKIDLLGLGMMAVLQDSLAMINRGRDGEPLTLANMPPDDPEVYRMLQEADTIGVFQVESRAQMATLPRLLPKRFYDIVVEVAIIRPGPIVGQMVHPYLNRRAGREPVVYPHPSLEPILARTLGVPLFQEQLLRIAMVAAGFTGGQAEELRRAFGFKRSERRMKQVEVQLREGMAKKGISDEAADEIVTAITAFALYGFPESHAASFALLVYASAYLKAHFPAAFYAGLLNNQPMGFYHPATLVKDAQRRGVRFAPIDVQRSGWPCAVEADGAVRLGLRYVNGLRAEVGRAIESVSAPSVSSALNGGCRRGGASAPPAGNRDDVAVASASSARDDAPRANQRRATSAPGSPGAERRAPSAEVCPKCGCDDRSMLEVTEERGGFTWFCNNCAHDWREQAAPPRFRSIEDLIARSGVNRDELVQLAEIGALSSFGFDRREASWQVERAIRPAGELFEQEEFSAEDAERAEAVCLHDAVVADRRRGGASAPPAAGRPEGRPLRRQDGIASPQSQDLSSAVRPETSASSGLNDTLRAERRAPSAPDSPSAERRAPSAEMCPLPPMTEVERITADYAGTGLTIGPHPMALRRPELAMCGVLRAVDLARERNGRRVRVAGAVITRQRPGTAKGFVFLTLEDETGIANIIVRPDLFARERLLIIEEPFLLVEGMLQNQEGVASVRAERLDRLGGDAIPVESHDFY